MLIDMLLFNLAGLIHEPVPSVDVIYSARYYYDDARKSRYQIYLGNLQGTKCRQLTFDEGSCYEPLWLDRNHIVYCHRVSYGPRYSRNNPTYNIEFVKMDVRTTERKIIKSLTATQDWPYVNRNERAYWIDRSNSGTDLSLEKYLLSGNSLKKVKYEHFPTQEIEHETKLGSDDIEDSYDQASLNVKGYAGGPDFHLTWRERDLNYSFSVRVGDISRSFALQGETLELVKPISATSLLLVTLPHYNVWVNDHFVYEVDIKSGSVKTLVKDVGNIELTPEREFWVGSQGYGSPMDFLSDGKCIYVNRLFGGSVKSGRKWPIATGFVHVFGFQLRPDKSTQFALNGQF